MDGVSARETLASGSRPLKRRYSFGPSQKGQARYDRYGIPVTNSVDKATLPVRMTAAVD